ncbi:MULTISPECIES: extracellular solute-binding protein [unclassified Brenneria]|uniref:extracellular solute-binding protein n=1 Tax=unclassified Brenneria TaxID=2634434 RepID=UPI0029C1A04E|nr:MULTISPECIES: extracellular solute-binding protein [unclassified Brenneria]MDX5630262.1 extracellular solute-binding protein [Brenneria sp. L3-3Z]MDX5697407.1 extracellular solute-binding protein [Brenneria sp. L4-2C]
MTKHSFFSLSGAAFIALLAVSPFSSAANSDTVKIVINQSPWLDGFKKTVAKYNQETGNNVTVDTVPYSGLLDKIRTSVRAKEGIYDVTMIDVNWLGEIYSGGFLTPIKEIEADYQLPDQVLTFGDALYWDKARAVFNKQTGDLYTFPVTANPQLFYYRKDIYEKEGVSVPKTWDELTANIKKLHQPPKQYGFLTEAGPQDIVFRITPFLLSAGGGVFKNPLEGDFSVILNSPESLIALKYYISIAKAGYSNPGSLAQGELIQLFATGKAAQANIVAAARGPLSNPDSSIVTDKFGVAVIPHPADKSGIYAAGHWVGGIPHNIPAANKKAALAFFKWYEEQASQVYLYEAGGVPVRSDLIGVAKDPLNFLPALTEATSRAEIVTPIKESAQINALIGLQLYKALNGEISPEQALNNAAKAVYDLVSAAGYNTRQLPELSGASAQ